MKVMTGKISVKVLIAVLMIILIAAVMYLLTPVGTERSSLNDRQIESLCVAFAGVPDSEENRSLEVTNQAAVKIFGVEDNGKYKTIYGYVSEGEYLKHRDKAYEISGGNWEFMVDVEIQGDDVRIIKEYGDGVSSESTYEEMPFRYRFQISNYNPFDESGYCKLGKEANKKAEAVLGVPVETKYTLSIEGNHYEISDIDGEGNVDVIDEGRVEEL